MRHPFRSRPCASAYAARADCRRSQGIARDGVQPPRRARPRLPARVASVTPRRRRLLIILAVVVAVLVGVRLALPTIVTNAVNARLASMGDYHGRIDDIDLALWRGAYRVHGLRIAKDDVRVPLLDAPVMRVKTEWGELLRGGIVARVVFESPTVHFVDGRSSADSQSGRGVDWRDKLEELVPTRIDAVEIHDGTVVFHNFVSDPPVDLRATQVRATIENLTNVRDEAGERVAHLVARGDLLDGADMEAEARFDPFGRLDAFELAVRVTGIDLTHANDLMRAYSGFDVESGRGEFVMELEASEGKLSGYAKPLFHDLRVFGKRDLAKNPLRIAWEALAQGVVTIFKNHAEDQFATRVSISGTLDDKRISTLDAVGGILRNAFVEAFKPYFENLPTRRAEDGKD